MNKGWGGDFGEFLFFFLMSLLIAFIGRLFLEAGEGGL